MIEVDDKEEELKSKEEEVEWQIQGGGKREGGEIEEQIKGEVIEEGEREGGEIEEGEREGGEIKGGEWEGGEIEGEERELRGEGEVCGEGNDKFSLANVALARFAGFSCITAFSSFSSSFLFSK